jgi:hypothetical protein
VAHVRISFLPKDGRDMPAEQESRLLIVTGAAVTKADELPPAVLSLIESASEILVVAPALPGRLEWLTSDTDRVRYEADERLRTVIGYVEELAPTSAVSGAVGDETPLSAFADAVREFRPDHILLALRAADHSSWQERGLIDRVREGFEIPVTSFEIDRAGTVPGPARTSSTPPAAGDPADEAERARTPRTPVLALTGVWLAVAVAFVVVLAVVVLVLYFV